jgi:deazaflavin-dependent oxidoreductase (nitroreductase family)
MWRLRPAVARFVNPVLRPLAGWLPAFGVVEHRGRRSGKVYRTPVNVFRRDRNVLFVLTYGSDAQWVRNVVAAGGCTLHTRGRNLELVEPEVVYDPGLSLVPGFARFVERHVAAASEILRMRVAPSP